MHLTKRLSGIHAAWHFWYAVGFGGESGLRKLGLGGIHPLTRRYVLGRNYDLHDNGNCSGQGNRSSTGYC
ncbi:DUF3265 domain-containing protein [Vibrio vulnificus]|nr:DUF3265 domain-containing protein [Vibrio vulnificus]